VPAGRLVCVATTPQLMILTTELKCSIKSPWSSWEDHRRRRPLWEWSGDLQQTDVIWRVPYVQHSSPKALRGDLTSTVSWARRHRHSKVLVMIEAAFLRCAETGCCHSTFARCRCCLILFCSSPLGFHYSQHACIESSVKFDAQLFSSSVKKLFSAVSRKW
jgi:hypothetical protein